MRWVVVPAALAMVLLGATPAAAHVELESSTPADGARLRAAPASIGLKFSDTVSAGRTRITLTGPAQAAVPVSKPAGTGSRVAVTVPGTLGNGVYTVAYRTVSGDGHVVDGTFRFTVAGPAPATPTPAPTTTTPAPTPAPTPAAPSAAPVAAAEDDGGPGAGVLTAAIGLPVLALLAAGVLLARRRTT